MTEDPAAYIATNRAEYGDHYDGLNFVTPEQAEVYQARRQDLLQALHGKAEVGYGGTKMDCTRLSPGCRCCGNGTWSCLFVNNRCNRNCFYCPTSQDNASVPGTNTLDFPLARDYAEYTERFGMDGVSFSGGEPLLTPDRTIEYLQALRCRRGDSVHTWLYTNGTLLNAAMVRRLRDAGLDEIRFDVAANGYDLTGVFLAAGIIPVVTVEIPALPDDAALLRGLLVDMTNAGVHFLNLHQLRLTPHNRPHLQRRGLTFLHGARITVLESELTALELLVETLDKGIPLPINYCSFVYKHRYQRAAARRRAAIAARKPFEDITENGYLRHLSLAGPEERLLAQVARLQAEGADPAAFCLNRANATLDCAASLWPLLAVHDLAMHVRYFEARLRPSPSYRHPFTKVELESGTQLYVERWPATAELVLRGPEVQAFATTVLGLGAPSAPKSSAPAESAHPVSTPPVSTPPVSAPTSSGLLSASAPVPASSPPAPAPAPAGLPPGWRAAQELETIRTGLQEYY